MGVKPQSVAIVAMGLSHQDYVLEAVMNGGLRSVADEVWTINHMAAVIQHDRAFMMDDFKAICEVRPAHDDCDAAKRSRHLDFMRHHPGPIYTSRAYPDYPGTVEYPLEAVINDLGQVYFNTTVAYAVGLAIHFKVRNLRLYGCDFTYSDRHNAEKGRACVEFLLGIATARGIQVEAARKTTLLDANTGGRPLYGYAERPTVSARHDGTFAVRLAHHEEQDNAA